MRTALTLLLLCGCAGYETDAQGYKWECGGTAVEPVRVHRGVDVYLNCAFESKAESCSVRRPDGCDIYLPERDREHDWMEAHERRHCGGCRHPRSI
jgi:hypothetical protein